MINQPRNDHDEEDLLEREKMKRLLKRGVTRGVTLSHSVSHCHTMCHMLLYFGGEGEFYTPTQLSMTCIYSPNYLPGVQLFSTYLCLKLLKLFLVS